MIKAVHACTDIIVQHIILETHADALRTASSRCTICNSSFKNYVHTVSMMNSIISIKLDEFELRGGQSGFIK